MKKEQRVAFFNTNVNFRRPVCSQCEVELRPHKNGVEVVKHAEWGPIAVFEADEWQCPNCHYKVIVGFGQGPIFQHFQDGFEAHIEQAAKNGYIRHNRKWPSVASLKQSIIPPDLEWLQKAIADAIEQSDETEVGPLVDYVARHVKNNWQMIELGYINQLVKVLKDLPSRFDSVDNGHCTVCRGHRFFVGTKSPKPGICENEQCWSHQRRRALEVFKGAQ